MLQAKGGTGNQVLSMPNPQGASAFGFKTPRAEEFAHDFLWRVHPHVPGKGGIAVFNRSHDEDVLVTRVHKLIDQPTWLARYHRIRQFEDLLIGNGANLAVSQIVADTMEGLQMSYPKPTVDLAEIRRKYHAAGREEKDAKAAN